jgi:hypothetical protein
MSDAAEYRLDADICRDCADAARSPLDRQIWLRLQQHFLRLAAEEDRQSAAVARSGRAEAA